MNTLDDDLFGVVQELRNSGRLSRNLWREFLCKCCREVWDAIANVASQHAVKVAERFVAGNATYDEMRLAYHAAKSVEDQAWEVVRALRQTGLENEWNWPLNEEVDQAWVRYCAACAAVACVDDCPDDVAFTSMPEAAASIRPWASARRQVIQHCTQCQNEKLRTLVEQRWAEMNAEEHRLQIRLLHETLMKTEDQGGSNALP